MAQLSSFATLVVCVCAVVAATTSSLLANTNCSAATTVQESSLRSASSSNTNRPYAAFCNTTVMGEKQLWNRDRKKIVSFALFAPKAGDNLLEWLRQGTLENIKDAKLFYPEWVVRIHGIGLSPSDQALFLQYDNVELVQCLATTPPETGLAKSQARKMITRFLPYDDPTVQYTISRDVDSRFSPRELLAVNDWIASGRCFHVMRDHQYHTNPIMGGMFGVRRGCLDHSSRVNTTASTPIRMSDLVQEALIKEPDLIVGAQAEDQSFLFTYVWPRVKGDTLSHDSSLRTCNKHGAAVCREFPMKRAPGSPEFVGKPFKFGGRGKTNRVAFSESSELLEVPV